jgi:gliding motility-associated-like protein
MKNVCGIILLLPALVISIVAMGQPGTYILNGSAVQNNCNCYTLTNESAFQSGSVWNAYKINLNNPFDFIFNVNLGCKDADGADGIAFILQPISTSLGIAGEGMGFEGVTPSIGISLDTWQNTNRNDPAYDHISIQANGVINHGSDLAGPIQASASSANIEDCQWHTFRISWDPVTFSLKTYFDGVFRLETVRDLVGTIFNNDPLVYWGFAAATGGSNNRHQFCTALNPDFNTSITGNATCIGNPVTFGNTSQSFAPINSYYWNFGDGNSSTAEVPPPHLYATPGIYQVKLAITGLDGCQSDTLRKNITIGDPPIANFEVFDTCSGSPPRIVDRSQVQVGSISQWNWSLNGNVVSTSQFPQLNGLSTGGYQLELSTTSSIGCPSTIVRKSFLVKARPVIEATGNNGCVNEPVSFSAVQMDNATQVVQWNWTFGDGNTISQPDPQHNYNAIGNYMATVTGLANNGCSSLPFDVPVFINRAYANAGNDTTAIVNTPLQLQASGGGVYSWSPSTGLNDPNIANPVALLTDDMRYVLTVTTAEGCTDVDEINVTVFKGSAVYVPTGFTPNGDGLNDLLRPYCVGIQKLDYFSVYNRWGELVFNTKSIGAGWNGSINGTRQSTGLYIWRVRAVDFLGKTYELKGTTSLIR